MMEQNEKFDFQKTMYLDGIPENVKIEVLPDGSTIYVEGKPNIKRMVKNWLRRR